MSVRPILIGLGALVVGSAAIYAFQPIQIGGMTLSFQWESQAESLLERLGQPDDATMIAETEVDGPDGPMPEMAMKTIGTTLDADAVRAFYRGKCAVEGLAEVSTDIRASQPDALCSGRLDGRTATVMVAPDCIDARCTVRLAVHVIFF